MPVLGGHDAAGGGELLHVVHTVPQTGELEEGAVLGGQNPVGWRGETLHPAHEVGVGCLRIQRLGILLALARHLLAQGLGSQASQGQPAEEGGGGRQCNGSFHTRALLTWFSGGMMPACPSFSDTTAAGLTFSVVQGFHRCKSEKTRGAARGGYAHRGSTAALTPSASPPAGDVPLCPPSGPTH